MKYDTVVPAVIPASLRDLEEAAARMRRCVPRIQVDFIDGRFAPQASWPFAAGDTRDFHALASQEKGLPFWQDLDYELDAMVHEPAQYLDAWNAVQFATVIIHLASTKDITAVMREVKARGMEAALAVRPSEDIALLAPHMEEVALVQCMGSDTIGFHGVALDPRVYKKIPEIKQRWPQVPVAVDIGVNEETAPRLRDAGADRLVSGSAVFSAPEPCAAVARLAGTPKR